MNQSVKRRGHTAPNGLPAMDDHKLAHLVAGLLLSAEDHRKAVLLTVGLQPGLYGQLKRPDRDWLVRFAIAGGVMPRLKPKPKAPKMPAFDEDHYSAKETPGAHAAAKLIALQVPTLGGTMPTPPNRRRVA